MPASVLWGVQALVTLDEVVEPHVDGDEQPMGTMWSSGVRGGCGATGTGAESPPGGMVKSLEIQAAVAPVFEYVDCADEGRSSRFTTSSTGESGLRI